MSFIRKYTPAFICKKVKECKDPKIRISLYKDIIIYLEVLHDRWVLQGKVEALIEANYFVDYLCSNIITACDNNKKNILKAPWKGLLKTDIGYTYDAFKNKKMTYMMGINKMYDFIHVLTDELYRYLDYKNIDTIPKQVILDTLNQVIDDNTYYYSSSMGMYRLVNLYPKDINKRKIEKRKPINCVCKTLLFLSILAKIGFPKEYLFARMERHKHDANDELEYKQSHLAAVVYKFSNLKNVYKYTTVPEFRHIGDINFGTSEAFIIFTRDIIIYYNYLLSYYEVKKKEIKHIILKEIIFNIDMDFLESYNLHTRSESRKRFFKL